VSKVISILIFVSMSMANAQSQFKSFYFSNTSPNSAIINELPSKFDIYLAAGIAAGGRVGFSYLFVNNFSAEISYGYDLRNFISLSDLQRRYIFGFNFHFDNSNAVLSLLNTYIDQPNSVMKQS
jgi:hypothetical protein